jgi:hypothetical protein
MKRNFLIALSLLSINGFSQEIEKKISKKFLVEAHYTHNVGNKNIISDGFNGIAGFDTKYIFAENNTTNFSAGLGIDFLKTKDTYFSKDLLFFNPNVGVDFIISNSGFNPFFNIGYSFANYKSERYSGINNPSDPMFNTVEAKTTFSGISINPGFRYIFKNNLFATIGYKFIPVKSDSFDGTASTHFLNAGIGIKL